MQAKIYRADDGHILIISHIQLEDPAVDAWTTKYSLYGCSCLGKLDISCHHGDLVIAKYHNYKLLNQFDADKPDFFSNLAHNAKKLHSCKTQKEFVQEMITIQSEALKFEDNDI